MNRGSLFESFCEAWQDHDSHNDVHSRGKGEHQTDLILLKFKCFDKSGSKGWISECETDQVKELGEGGKEHSLVHQ